MRNGLLIWATILLVNASVAVAQPVLFAEDQPVPRKSSTSTGPEITPPEVKTEEVRSEPLFPGWIEAEVYPGERNWAMAEYLLWIIEDAPLPQPIITTGPTSRGGVINTPGVLVLVGGDGINFEVFSGARFTFGRWLDNERTLGIEASGFWLEEGSKTFFAESHPNGDPLLARPIVDVQTGDETSVLLSANDLFAGGLNVTATSQLWSAEGNVVMTLLREGRNGIELLAGFRYLSLDEDLDISSVSQVLPGGVAAFGGDPVFAPNALAIRDVFATTNQFYGGQIGARGTVQRGGWRVDVTGKVAFGAVHQQVRTAGFTSLVTGAGVDSTIFGGVLALPTNSGRRASNDGSVVPEASIRLAYQFTQRLSAHVGYNILFWDNVVRPGDQISRRINLTQLPSSFSFGPLTGPRQPAPLFLDSRYWAQGLTFGLAFRF